MKSSLKIFSIMESANTYPSFYKDSLSLLTDLYQMTMSYAYWKNGLDGYEAVFHLFFRKKTFGGGFTVAAGLEPVIRYLQNFRFEANDLEYLASLKGSKDESLFPDPRFFDYLSKMRFSCDVDAVPEGTVVFPYEPLLRVQGPIIQAQLLESALLNQINFASLIATKAARVRIAAKNDIVMEFGLRRAQGIDGALTASRSAYVGGCDYSSNLLAGKLFGIPVMGTHSHSWVMVFDDEIESFRQFAKALPDNCVFLVDTYNSIEGIKKAIEVGRELKTHGYRMLGVRLDSGDLGYLSIACRELLDEAGFSDAQIVASNELDEVIISELKRQGAKISVWGVGTHLVTGKDQPALDGVYKLSAVRNPKEAWKFRLKLSEQMVKISNPGILQVRRFYNKQGNLADAIIDMHSDLRDGCWIVDPFDSTRRKFLPKETAYQDLLAPIFRQGELVYPVPSLESVRENTQKELKGFHDSIKRFINPHEYVVGMEKTLYQLKMDLIKKVRGWPCD